MMDMCTKTNAFVSYGGFVLQLIYAFALATAATAATENITELFGAVRYDHIPDRREFRKTSHWNFVTPKDFASVLLLKLEYFHYYSYRDFNLTLQFPKAYYDQAQESSRLVFNRNNYQSIKGRYICFMPVDYKCKNLQSFDDEYRTNCSNSTAVIDQWPPTLTMDLQYVTRGCLNTYFGVGCQATGLEFVVSYLYIFPKPPSAENDSATSSDQDLTVQTISMYLVVIGLILLVLGFGFTFAILIRVLRNTGKTNSRKDTLNIGSSPATNSKPAGLYSGTPGTGSAHKLSFNTAQNHEATASTMQHTLNFVPGSLPLQLPTRSRTQGFGNLEMAAVTSKDYCNRNIPICGSDYDETDGVYEN